MPADQLTVAVIGGGPAGLMAAEVLAQGGADVRVYDRMPTMGRKLLMAGRGGLNISHSEPLAQFCTRYGERIEEVSRWLECFTPQDIRQWMETLGIASFVGSSGRVFPVGMKAAPLLRAWLRRLHAGGVQFFPRHRWLGFSQNKLVAPLTRHSETTGHHATAPADPAFQAFAVPDLRFQTPSGEVTQGADAVVLALGGGSWPKLGSDGAWVDLLKSRRISVSPLLPANCGFDAGWSPFFRQKFAGQVLKSIRLHFAEHSKSGDLVVTANGLEGGPIYGLSAPLRNAIAQHGFVECRLDLLPGKTPEAILAAIAAPRGARSLASHLQSRVGITGVKAGLLRECAPQAAFQDMPMLAAVIKSLPLRLLAPRPLAEAISSAGGVEFSGLNQRLMLSEMPGVFCAGEMLDWEAPTGGYLLTGCLASGRIAGQGVLAWFAAQHRQIATM